MSASTVIGAIVVFDDGHEQVVGVDEHDAFDVMVRGGVMVAVENGTQLQRDGAQVKHVRWLRGSREESTR